MFNNVRLISAPISDTLMAAFTWSMSAERTIVTTVSVATELSPLTIILVVPSFTPVTLPVAETVATSVSDDDHLKSLQALDGYTVGLIW